MRALPGRGVVAGAGVFAAVTALVAPPASAAPSTGVVIAEVYGGGGNSGARLTTDFVELTNLGNQPATLSGLSVQYLPAKPKPTSRWQATALAGAIAPGGRYLVAEATGNGGTVALPTPDASGFINMSGRHGTVALVEGTQPLTCLTMATCASDPRIRDVVGYGNAEVREGQPAPATDNTTSVARGLPPVDTDDNAADFAVGPPSPTNSAGETPDPGPDPVTAAIHQIQGTTRVSPLDGQQVSGVTGIVTAIRQFGSSKGFWFQDPTGDTDPRTSGGLFVFTGSTTPDVAPGDAVTVSGTVHEYYPGGGDSAFQSVTELFAPEWTVLSSGNPLPAPTEIGPDTVPDELTAKPGGSIEPAELAPDKYSLDFWESKEGELIAVTDVRVVGPTTEFNELYITTKRDQHPTPRGGTAYTGYDEANTGVLKIESLLPFDEHPFPRANTGDVLSGLTSGPVEYDRFGGYTLLASTLGRVEDHELHRETAREQRSGELAIATYNLENLSGVSDQAKFDELARGIVRNLSAPDIVALEEIQDNNGPDGHGDGVVAADITLQRLIDAIAAAGGPRYYWRQINPQDLADGGQPGGNIRVGFLFNPARVSFVDRPGGDATTPVEIRTDGGDAHLSISPGRIDPGNFAWVDSRKPLVGEFVFGGRTVFVVANHFASKGGDQPIHGRFQPPTRSSEEQRIQQAQVLREFADDLLAADPDANLVIAGDLNDYLFSPTLQTLTEGDALTALMGTLPENEQYSYIFDGNSQVLDHILVSQAPRGVNYDVVHINAEFADQASDHDPQVARLRPSTGDPALDRIYDLLDLLERLLGS